MNPSIPIWLGTGMESTVKLTAEIADGWLPLGLVPENYGLYSHGLKRVWKRPVKMQANLSPNRVLQLLSRRM